jgi:DNA repair protein RadC
MENLHSKLRSRGAAAMTDEELLALMLESGGDGRDPKLLAANLLAEGGSLTGVLRMDVNRLRMAEGIGMRRAERLVVAKELGRRVVLTSGVEVEKISTDADVVRLMRPQLERLSYEECWVLYLTSSNMVIERQRVSQGGVQATVVDHRLIIKRALELLATQLIMVHNHPSGMPRPSEADIQLTKCVKDAAALFNIQLLDHVIISKEGDYSFRRNQQL